LKAIELLNAKLTNDNIKTVYLINGYEAYLRSKVIEQLIGVIPSEQRSMNLGKFDLESDLLAAAVNDARSVPFFGERRITLISHPLFLTAVKSKKVPEQNIADLENYLKQPEPTTTLIIDLGNQKMDARKKISKLLKKVSVIVDCSALPEKKVQQLVTEQTKRNEFSFTEDALELLIKKTEANYSTIMNELPKLELAALQTKKITQSMVAELVPQTLEQNVFELSNLVLAEKNEQAMNLYHDLLLQHEEPLKLNAILIGQVRLLLQTLVLMKHGYAQGDIASVLKVHPYRVKLALQQAPHFSRTKLREIYLNLIKFEEQLKTSQQDPEKLFQLLLLGYLDYVTKKD
jgi:DNA polymerase-3 subunit delta